ncbi:MAG: hypothetical protein CM1200mP24_05430 [Gammaproteobacteria bacterium]|nr:MAG: hypothetical protein CM1200mP24_05430 [Gammaproteobacteria bacterium]
MAPCHSRNLKPKRAHYSVTQPGDSTTRIITIEAYGLTAAAIPPFEFNVSNNLRGYEDPPELIDRIRINKFSVSGGNPDTRSYIFRAPRKLPPHIVLVECKQRSLEQAILPPQYFEIQGTTNETRENKRITDSFEEDPKGSNIRLKKTFRNPPMRLILILIVPIG